MTQSWYAIRVRSNFENRTRKYLEAHGIETFLPTYKEVRRWSDRLKEVDMPLFSGYVFSRIDLENRGPVMQAPGVVSIVGFGKKFVPVASEEIEAVRAVVNSPVFARPCPYLTAGERVIIRHGPLAGIEGLLVEIKNDHRLVVSVHLLQRSISAEVRLDWVKPIKQVFPVPTVAA